MTTHDSDSDLVGKIGASLTPRVLRMPVQQRGEQNSGLFDIGALQAASMQQIMRRVQTAREQPPVLGIARITVPAPTSPIHSWPPIPVIRQAPSVRQEIVIELDPEPEPVPRVRGVGWFGVAVAWLATTALGVTVATTVPAHVTARGSAAGSALATAAPVVVAPVALATALAGIPVAPIPTAATAPSQPVAPVPPATERAIVALPVKAAVSPSRARPRPNVRAVPASPPTPAAPPQPQQSAPAAEAPPARAVAPPPPPPAAAPAAAGASLEELMRRAVAADAKKH